MDVLSLLDIALAWELLTTTSDPLDFLCYGIAIYEGYKLSFTKLRLYRLRVLGQWFDGIRFYAAASSPRRSRRTWAGLR